MKLNIKAMGLACAILYVVGVLWAYIMAWAGVSQAPFDVLNGFYLGWLGAIASPALSLIIGLALTFVDGFVAGMIFAWLYNRFAKAA
ncbi:MAG: hypothetical protein JXA24_03545 [Proteobacteria bacterium]|nr:hypothetical protein [Pseudomonadota bacterium]